VDSPVLPILPGRVLLLSKSSEILVRGTLRPE
jgi:hypothetical protein